MIIDIIKRRRRSTHENKYTSNYEHQERIMAMCPGTFVEV